MRTTKIRDSQTWLDIAMQEVGSIEKVFELAMANEVSVTTDLVVGDNVKLIGVADEAVVNVFVPIWRKPASGITIIDDDDIGAEGIEFWQTENDFIIL